MATSRITELTVWGIAGARLRNVDLSYHSGGHRLSDLTK
jgi:hypothetical protein